MITQVCKNVMTIFHIAVIGSLAILQFGCGEIRECQSIVLIFVDFTESTSPGRWQIVRERTDSLVANLPDNALFRIMSIGRNDGEVLLYGETPPSPTRDSELPVHEAARLSLIHKVDSVLGSQSTIVKPSCIFESLSEAEKYFDSFRSGGESLHTYDLVYISDMLQYCPPNFSFKGLKDSTEACKKLDELQIPNLKDVRVTLFTIPFFKDSLTEGVDRSILDDIWTCIFRRANVSEEALGEWNFSMAWHTKFENPDYWAIPEEQ